MHLAFCTPNRNVGIMNCLFASLVGLASLFKGGFSCALFADEGGSRVLFELRVEAHRLAFSFGTPTSASSSSYMTVRPAKVARP
jgi:hypothetical protein